MVEKTTYLELVEKLDSVCTAYELKTLNDDNRSITSAMDDFVVHVLLMGGFSAGKSTLLNAFMGRDILPEDQAEKTAIATELIFDEKEYVEAISENGTEIYSLEEIDSIDAEQYEYLCAHINSDFLRELDGIRIVDMPGLNSKIENHNKAIMKYIGKGNAYLLCVSCADGTLMDSSVRFINEIKQYKNSLVLAVTKCDVKPEKDVHVIAAKIQGTAQNAFGEKIETYEVSADDEDIREKGKTIIGSFNAQNLFEQAFAPSILNNAALCINALMTVRKNADCSTQELDLQIKQLEQSKKELDRKIQAEKKNLLKKMHGEVKQKILSDVENALRAHLPVIVSAAKVSPEEFSRTVNEIVRPILINATQTYSEEAFSAFIGEKELAPTIGDDAAEKLAVGYKGLNDRINTFIQSQPKDEDGNFTGKYKTITSLLAIATDVLDPVVEILIVFLPEILNFVSGLFQQSRDNAFAAKIENEVIPQIVLRIGESLDPVLNEMQESMLNVLMENYELECNSMKEAAEKLNAEKSNQQLQMDEYLAKLESDIATVKQVIESLS